VRSPSFASPGAFSSEAAELGAVVDGLEGDVGVGAVVVDGDEQPNATRTKDKTIKERHMVGCPSSRESLASSSTRFSNVM